MAYATSITMYRNRNHTVRVTVDLTTLVSIQNATVRFSVRRGAVTENGAIVINKTNLPSIVLGAEVILPDTVEFYLQPSDTSGLTAGNYTADATITTTLGTFQLLAPLALTLMEPVTP
ncbi:MAG: hypothetical protein WC505_06830 [Patescibacteria group bacterium]